MTPPKFQKKVERIYQQKTAKYEVCRKTPAQKDDTKSRNVLTLAHKHGILRRAIRVNIPKSHITYRSAAKIQENSSNGYVPTTPPTATPPLSNKMVNFKMN